MDGKNGSNGGRPKGFLEGKGFYIVLVLCAGVIGVSAWSLLRGTGTVEELPGDIALEETMDPYDDSLAGDPEYDDELWVIPDGVEEVLAEVEPPEIVSETLAESAETLYASAEAPFISPVSGETLTPYSMAALRYDMTMRDWRTHDGVDIAASVGTAVLAASSGTVVKIYDDELYGTTVVIDHGDGLMSTYSNLAAAPTVAVGDTVLFGETIGAVGDTAICESAMAAHLHFAMSLSGGSADPTDYLPAA